MKYYYLIPVGLYTIYKNYENLCVLYSLYIDPILSKKCEVIKPFSNDDKINVDNIQTLTKEGYKIIENLNFVDWLNYLHNVIDTKPDTKWDVDWDKVEIILIHYTYKNKEYTMYIKEDFNKQTPIKIKNSLIKDVLSATITNENETRDITKELKRFVGPNGDFHNNNCKEIKSILHNFNIDDWCHINILDSFGILTTIDLKKDDYINLKTAF